MRLQITLGIIVIAIVVDFVAVREEGKKEKEKEREGEGEKGPKGKRGNVLRAMSHCVHPEHHRSIMNSDIKTSAPGNIGKKKDLHKGSRPVLLFYIHLCHTTRSTYDLMHLLSLFSLSLCHFPALFFTLISLALFLVLSFSFSLSLSLSLALSFSLSLFLSLSLSFFLFLSFSL